MTPTQKRTAGTILDTRRMPSIALSFCMAIEFVADTYFAGGVDDDVPEAHLLVEFAEEEDLDMGAGLFFLAVEEGREDAGVVGHHYVAFVDIFDEIFEDTVLNFAAVAMQHKHTSFVAVAGRFFGNKFFR